jgi:bifunctional DNA-binding transcriptional regulator/antitoxin component of YhaV-PrlF toxin-antitoxin module
MIHTMKLDTIVTTKGTTTIPQPYRKELGISSGTIISWQVQAGKLVGVKKPGAGNALQAHIHKYSGVWKGASKVLRKTRGRDV